MAWKTAWFLIAYLMIFAGIFFAAFIDFTLNTPIISIGLPAQLINLVVLGLSLLGIGKTVWHIIHHDPKKISDA